MLGWRTLTNSVRPVRSHLCLRHWGLRNRSKKNSTKHRKETIKIYKQEWRRESTAGRRVTKISHIPKYPKENFHIKLFIFIYQLWVLLKGIIREIIQVLNVVLGLFYGTEGGNNAMLHSDSRVSSWVSFPASNTILDNINM